MLNAIAAAVVGMFLATTPAFAGKTSSRVDDTNFTNAHGAHGMRVDCVGTVVWDTGMYDTFTPPTGCSSAGSTACFVNARNDQGIESDWRQFGAQFIGAGGDPITNVKLWGRYNQNGYDWQAVTPGAFHGFCLRIYDDPSQGSICPDGTIVDALGTPVYDVYVDSGHFVAEEVPTGIARCFNYCITLPTPFHALQDHFYWMSVSADFDNTQYNGGWTQWFWRLAPPGSAILCEPVANYNSTVGDHQNWDAIWRALNIPCWEGWDLSLVLYSNPVQPQIGACCFTDGHCQEMTDAECAAAGGAYQGDGTHCDPNPCPLPTGACCVGLDCSIHTRVECESVGGVYMGDGVGCDPNPCATPTRPSTWGKIKQGFKGTK